MSADQSSGRVRRLMAAWSSRPRSWNVLIWVEHFAAAFRRERRPPPGPAASPLDGGRAEGDSGLFVRIPAPGRFERDKSSPWERIKRWALGRERVPIPSYIGLIEDPPKEGEDAKTGICCSGGGIRSAAFNLGALQELQDAGRLQAAKYVAAVSGGSYIAAAFSMVAKTPKPNEPDSDDSDPELFTPERPPFYHGSPEEQYLRNRSSYMAPGGAGRARLALRVALGLFVNVALLTASLVLLAWLLALYYRLVHGPLQNTGGDAEAGTRTLEWLVIAGLGVIALGFGLISVFLESKYDRAKQGLESLTIRLLSLALIGLVVAVALPELIAFVRNEVFGTNPSDVGDTQAKSGATAAASGGFGALLVAVLLQLRAALSVKKAKEAAAWFQKLAAPVRRALAGLGTWLVGPLVLGSILMFALVAMVSARHISAPVIAVVAVVFAVFWLFSDVTSWSLHPFYRRRLCTAFALKRVKRKAIDAGTFGVARERDYGKLVLLSESGVEPGPGRPFKTWPTLVVCAAANVSDPGATPPGRSVTSFTFSPVAMGGPLVGGVPTADFENYIAPGRRRDFTLAAAVAMSGAAVSPSMGKETKASIRFLLGLANVRLGVWVPNPRRTKRWRKSTKEEGLRKLSAPHAGPWYLVKEMCGWNSVNDPFLYVTDGGHYENLGLVELLRRGCTEVFCFDASGGTRLDALGDAIALARSELNVEIDLDVSPLMENRERLAKSCCVTGTITYPPDENGVERKGILLYARTVVTKKAPHDVQAFRIRDAAFPHHSTLDQLYTDEKFEAYRELGCHAGKAALEQAAEPT